MGARVGLRVGMAFELGRDVGAGHCVRSMALGAALRADGATVDVAADFRGYGWALEQARALGLDVLNRGIFGELVSEAIARRWDVVVVDSYRVTPDAFRGLNVPLVVIDDLASRPLPADVVVNQNLIAWECDYAQWNAKELLRGPEFALLRPAVVEARAAARGLQSRAGRRRRVLVLLGGTDASGLVADLTRDLVAVDLPLEIVAVAPSPQAEAALRALSLRADTSLDVIAPVPDIEKYMLWSDFVVTAAGSTVWELCCIGRSMAIVVVADNQARNAQLLADSGVAVLLGRNSAANTQILTELLNDQSRLERMKRAAGELIDGKGARRAAAAIQSFCNRRKDEDNQ